MVYIVLDIFGQLSVDRTALCYLHARLKRKKAKNRETAIEQLFAVGKKK